MSETMLFVRPMAGRDVRDPDSLVLLAQEGEAKPRNVFWLRRIADEDVEEAEPPTEATAEEEA